MSSTDLDFGGLIKVLIDNFNILSAEVQLLSDQKTILQHRAVWAHEQYQALADRYAPSDPEISGIIAKLQLPQELSASATTSSVPLPNRRRASNHSLQVAVRDGRRASRQLTNALTGSPSFRSSSGGSSNMKLSARRTSLSTVLETDFTSKGIRGSLACPFQVMPDTSNRKEEDGPEGDDNFDADVPLAQSGTKDHTPHQSKDPICAAMYAETITSHSPSVANSANKCPIRYLDQHTPEEIARYFETHKHEIPRSHEVCVKRYQTNENDIKKLDAKYSNLVSMIQGLGGIHQPMLPSKEEEELFGAEQASDERVESWANNVSADGVGSETPGTHEEERSSRFDRDRPLKEVRVGESPSRPWGISVPILDEPSSQIPSSPPPAPVSLEPHIMAEPAKQCPYGRIADTTPLKGTSDPVAKGKPGACPFGHGQPLKEHPTEQPRAPPVVNSSPVFINADSTQKIGGASPQFLFTGPVFIGYGMEQAIAFMNQYQRQQQ